MNITPKTAQYEKKPYLADMPDVLQEKHIRTILNISRQGAYALMHSKGFPTIRIGEKRMVVPKAAFIRWLDEQASKGI